MFHAKKPGSLMLLGEHAVLRGKHAIACPVESAIHVKLSPRHDRSFLIQSNLGKIESHLDQISIQKPFEFVLTAIQLMAEKLAFGFNLFIESNIPTNLGLGSSASVTVATLDCLNQYLNSNMSKQALLQQSREVIRAVQGMGSGCDAAASLWECPVFCSPNGEVIPLPSLPKLTILYSGYKTPTAEVIATVNAGKHPQHIFDKIDELVLAGKDAIIANDWPTLGQIFNQAHELMRTLQVSTLCLDKMVELLKQTPGIYGAKISGSGLGDCVIGLGKGSVSLPQALIEKGVREVIA